MNSETPQGCAKCGETEKHTTDCYFNKSIGKVKRTNVLSHERVTKAEPEEPQTEATRPSAELTVKQAIKRTKEWQESDELAIAPEIITALLEAAESYDSAAAQIATLKAEKAQLRKTLAGLALTTEDVTAAAWGENSEQSGRIAALEKALRGAITAIEGLEEQQAMRDDWHLPLLESARAALGETGEQK